MKENYLMKGVVRIIIPAVILVFAQTVLAQTTPTIPDTSKMTYNQISSGLKLYVFPAKGQSKQQQKKDEFDCYMWAIEQSGIDPLNLPKVTAPVQSGPTGGAVKGSAKGAAAGAAIGATAGAMKGRQAGKQAQAQSNQQAQANAAASEQEMKDNFNKAFSVCIEGKGYTIK
jgi:hypothetical protein